MRQDHQNSQNENQSFSHPVGGHLLQVEGSSWNCRKHLFQLCRKFKIRPGKLNVGGIIRPWW
jgi:hypothetical protein